MHPRPVCEVKSRVTMSKIAIQIRRFFDIVTLDVTGRRSPQAHGPNPRPRPYPPSASRRFCSARAGRMRNLIHQATTATATTMMTTFTTLDTHSA